MVVTVLEKILKILEENGPSNLQNVLKKKKRWIVHREKLRTLEVNREELRKLEVQQEQEIKDLWHIWSI